MAGRLALTDTASTNAAVRYRRLLGSPRETWIQYAVLLPLALLVAAPVVVALVQSFGDRPLYDSPAFNVSSYVRLFSEESFGTVVLNSAAMSLLTTVMSLVVGVGLAILLVRVRVPGGALMSSLVLWPIYISPLVLAFGWIIVYGPAGYLTGIMERLLGHAPWDLYTIPGMALTSSVAFIPLVFLYCSNALLVADASLENAARICGAGPLRVLRSVIFPPLRPAIMYSGLIVLTGSLEELSIPLLYGTPVGIELFGSFLYDDGIDRADPDYGVLGAAAVLCLLLLAVLIIVQGVVLRNSRRFISVRGKASRVQRFDIGGLTWVGLVAAVAYLVLGPLLPLAGLVARAFTQVLSPLLNPLEVVSLSNFHIVLGYQPYIRSIGNSLLVAVIGAAVTTLVAALAVVVATRSRFRFAKVTELTCLAPQALSGLILGLGFFWTILFIPALRPLQGSLVTIGVAFGVSALPVAFSAIAPMVMQIGEELDHAARTVGSDWWRTFSRVLARLLTPALLSSFVLVFVIMIKAFSAAVFLGNADSEVIGTTSLSLWLNGNTGAVAALSCLQVAITTLVVFLAGKSFKVNTRA